MKKLLLLLAVFLSVCTVSEASDREKKPKNPFRANYISIKAGPNVSFPYLNENRTSPGGVVGVSWEKRYTRRSAFVADLQLSLQGIRFYKDQLPEDNHLYYGGFVYLQAPILYQLYLSERVTLHTGLQFGLWFFGFDASSFFFNPPIPDIALPVGITCRFPCGLSLEARYTWSLFGLPMWTCGPSRNKPNGESPGNRVLSLTAAWRFPQKVRR